MSTTTIRKYILTGVLVWLPLAVTIWVLLHVAGLLNGVFAWMVAAVLTVLPASAAPVAADLLAIPGLSIILMLLALFFTGLAVTNIAGQWLLNQTNRLFSNIPIVKSIYTSVRQVSDTLFSSSGQAFRQAVLVEYPRAGAWTIAFVTGRPGGEVAERLHSDMLTVYVPTTPNPTSGFMLVVRQADVIELSMSVDAALKYVISMGVVAPPMHSRPLPPAPGARTTQS